MGAVEMVVVAGLLVFGVLVGLQDGDRCRDENEDEGHQQIHDKRLEIDQCSRRLIKIVDPVNIRR